MSKIWFIDEDGRVPKNLYIMYDHDYNSSVDYLHLKKGIPIIVDNPLRFVVNEGKWSNIEYIDSWDFIPNSIGVLLVNNKALEVLNHFASSDFQVVPAELSIKDGNVVGGYNVINILKNIDSAIESKSILNSNPLGEWDKYSHLALDPEKYEKINLAVTKKYNYICSDKLKKEIKNSNLKGLTFKEKGIREFFVYE